MLRQVLLLLTGIGWSRHKLQTPGLIFRVLSIFWPTQLLPQVASSSLKSEFAGMKLETIIARFSLEGPIPTAKINYIALFNKGITLMNDID